jgi:putative hydroxymethylpyrimidine transport system substrate-binding protein
MNPFRHRPSLKLRAKATPRAFRAVGGFGVLALSLALAGCGEVKNTITPKPGTANQLTVELSGPPSAYYVGVYAAAALGYFKQTDINVTIQIPDTGDDPLTMLHDKQVLAAISSEPSLFLARNQNQPLVAVAALIRKPLSQVPVKIPAGALPSGGAGITGKTGTSTSTTATSTATTTTKAKTGTPATGKRKTRTTKTRTGKTTTGTTTTGTVIATTTTATTTTGKTTTVTTTTPTPAQVPTGSAWPAKLQQLLAQSDAPTYDALVVVVRKGTVVEYGPLIRRFVQAIARGYQAVRNNPAEGVSDLIAADPGLATQQRALLATVKALLPAFFPGNSIWGWQPEARWNAFGTWMTTNGLITNPNALSNASTNELLQGEGI